MDFELLIAEVYARAPLWMVKHRLHHNRNAIEKLWDEVAKALDATKDNVKYKWKYLKDNYRKEVKKIRQCTSGDAGGSFDVSKWPYFELLYFLKDEVNPSQMTGNLKQSLKINSDKENEQHRFEDTELPINSDEFFNVENEDDVTPTPSTATIQLDEPGASTKPYANQSVPYIRKRKETFNETVAKKMLVLEEQKLELLKTDKEEPHCDDYHFLMSLLPHFKGMGNVQKLRLRNKITQDVIDELQNNNTFTTHSLHGFTTFNYDGSDTSTHPSWRQRPNY